MLCVLKGAWYGGRGQVYDIRWIFGELVVYPAILENFGVFAGFSWKKFDFCWILMKNTYIGRFLAQDLHKTSASRETQPFPLLLVEPAKMIIAGHPRGDLAGWNSCSIFSANLSWLQFLMVTFKYKGVLFKLGTVAYGLQWQFTGAMTNPRYKCRACERVCLSGWS